jgi:hypothetical protein
MRTGKSAGRRRLHAVRAGFEFDPVTQAALDEAAAPWAAVRNTGPATAHTASLDGDAILAAQSILAASAGDVIAIATDNPGHLLRFPRIDARPWQSINS